ncbi:MAG: tRNA pseudouridine(55) synthase TruB [Clostridia bacterium]|nr:tRNA pseudouridine(55) synthase TruB [Clostridia bacterium]MBR3038648.1 tRNA pseudouridine(55) synthase TruB [Clostridia bacterium]MBR3130073.1 tRNA pseudouridine(55) synthase TruB [Clostridia bacterium]
MEGIAAVLKPPSMSSSDVVVDVRRIYETRRVGHLGTLDPEAAGVLPVCVGRAVRLFDYLVDKQKTYLCEIVFGTATDTQDAQGTVTETSDRVVTEAMLDGVLPQFTGRLLQTPPMYSALKYNGRKLYELALEGKEIPDKSREITIATLERAETLGKNRFLLSVVCSRGTYIRTLCSDIGKALGVPAHMAFLLRTASGAFTIDRTFTIAELETMKAEGRLSKSLICCEEAVSHLLRLDLKADRRKPAMNGLPTRTNAADGIYRMYCGGFLGVGTVQNGDAVLKVHLYSE